MSLVNRLIFDIKRSDSSFSRFAKRTLRYFHAPTLPRLPGLLKMPMRLAYELHFFTIVFFRSLITICYRNPLFQGRCESFGRGVSLEGLPFVDGHVAIHLGNGVRLGGKISIHSGGILKQPKLIVGDRSSVGWGTKFTVNKEVIIEEDVLISYDCRISDSDGHRREADLRAAGLPPEPKDIRPVRICRYAFIGNGSHIMKGVTIGEGATVAANSLVISNVPAYSLAVGNPAEVLFRNYGLPSTASRKSARRASVAETDR
jgi:acetyltransferase-like isoleucine patch superfamily enzyme